MLITEEEARTKWCPFVRMEGENRAFDADGFLAAGRSYHCLGSDCMAWRTLHAGHARSQEKGSGERGYCGLAGRPEYLKTADRVVASRSYGASVPAPSQRPPKSL